MGKPKFGGMGPIDMQNSVGDVVYSRNHYGTYTKSKGPTPEATPALEDWQDVVKSTELAWQSLTDTQRIPWYSYFIKRKNQMATTITISGHEAFISVNLNLYLSGGTPTSTPPVYSPVNQIEIVSFIQAPGNIFDLTVSAFDNTSNRVVVYSSFPVPPGRMSFNQIYGYWLVSSASYIPVPYGQYVSRFRVIPAGWKIFIKVFCVNYYTGRRGVPKYASLIV